MLEVMSGEDTDAFESALNSAKAEASKPSLIIVHTNIAEGTPKQGSASSHGSPLGEENIAVYKKSLEWEYPDFTVPDEVYAYMGELYSGFKARHDEYERMLVGYKAEYPELYAELIRFESGELTELADDDELWAFDNDVKLATRKASEIMLTRLTARIPNLIGGSADLGPSNLTYMKAFEDFSKDNYGGRNFRFGIREFAMAAICNGMALYGGLIPYCATFLVFADYLKPAERLSALMGAKVLYVLTHDSIGVGEDGPTHQPIEQLDMLRATPNTRVFRPADGRETAAAYISALGFEGPSILALSRQNLPQIEGTGKGALRGGYILRDCCGEPRVILMASGSEVEITLDAADKLKEEGVNVRVVSMPCMELFDAQPKAYRESVLPSSCTARVACEALGGMAWYKYLGLNGKLVSMKSFGASAPASELFRVFEISAQTIVNNAKQVIC